jgi:CHASE3 domain sensor protein
VSILASTVLLLGSAALSYGALRTLGQASYAALETGAALDRLEHAMSALKDAEAELHDAARAGDDAFVASERSMITTALRSLDRLRRISTDDPGQQKTIERIAASLARESAALEGGLHAERRGEAPAGEAKRALRDIRRLIAEADEDGRGSLHDRECEAMTSADVATVIVLLGSAVSGAVCAVWAYAAFRTAKPSVIDGAISASSESRAA